MPTSLAILDVLSDQAAVLDSNGLIIETNAAWKTFALENGGVALSGISYVDACRPAAHDPDVLTVAEALHAILRGERTHFEHEYPCHSASEERWFLMRATALPEGGALVLHTNITRRKLAELKADELANFDVLTRVLNRRGFSQRLSLERSRMHRHGTRLSALLLDCDDFKTINTHYGHAVGDVVLVELARRLCDSVRPEDAIGRIGGDEFVILLPETGHAEAMVVAERIRLSVGSKCMASVVEGEVFASVSLGVASLDPQVNSIDGILRECRAGLMRSKSAGKNRVQSSSGERSPAERRLLECRLQMASQPIVQFSTENVVGQELLARPDSSFSGPIEYFRLAAEASMLRRCDVLCLQAGAALAARLNLAGVVNLNVYPSTFLELEAQDWKDLFPDPALRSRVCLELSEQEIVGGSFPLQEKVAMVRDLGMKIAIDDVGFGRTCLENLVLLEPDVIKIDRIFVSGIQHSRAAVRQLERLIRLAHTLDANIVVEGVEAQEEFEICRTIGNIEFGQGYLWGRPQLI
jgi:diguanylate cyclase (GGDEF)-like protein